MQLLRDIFRSIEIIEDIVWVFVEPLVKLNDTKKKIGEKSICVNKQLAKTYIEAFGIGFHSFVFQAIVDTRGR